MNQKNHRSVTTFTECEGVSMSFGERASLYLDAWDLWGSFSQMDMVIEECSELTKAIIKSRRQGKTFTQDVLEEIADVEIMLEELQVILKTEPSAEQGKNLYQQVERFKENKLKRLKTLVEADGIEER